jgi:Spy/CpxP family protein refolding chaperone
MASTSVHERISGIGFKLLVGAGFLVAQTLTSPAIAAGGGPGSDRMVDRMASRLNLSDSQVQQVKAIFAAHADEMTAHFQALRTARQALRQTTLQTPPNESAIRNAAQALAQAEGDAALLRSQVHAQILPLLSPDQQQKLANFESGAHGRWKGRGPASSQ